MRPDWARFYAMKRFGLAGKWLFKGLKGRWRCCRLPDRGRGIADAVGFLNGCKKLALEILISGQ